MVFSGTDSLFSGGGQDQCLVLLRLHYVDPQVLCFIDHIQGATGWPVCVALDRINGNAVLPSGYQRIEMTREIIERLNLFITGDVLWRCGDYALYVAREYYPKAAFIWMIEPDVRLNFLDAGIFFDVFRRQSEFDLLATQFGRADSAYAWTRMMSPFASVPYRCMYPILRVSARAVDYMLSRRQALSVQYATERLLDGNLRSPDLWPNDEVFTATELQQAGFNCADINCTGIEFYNDSTFSYATPIAESRFGKLPVDGKIYHPVLAGEAYLRKVRGMFEHVRNHGGPLAHLRTLFDRPQLYDDIQMECGEGERVRFQQEVYAAIELLS